MKRSKHNTDMMRRCYEYRLYPNKTQTTILNDWFETHRQYYNRALKSCLNAWDSDADNKIAALPSLEELQKEMAIYRRGDQFGLDLNQNSIQHTVKRVSDAWDVLVKFMREGREVEDKAYGVDGFGVPSYKKRYELSTITFTYPSQGVKFIEYPDAKPKLQVSGLGEVKIRFHRPFPEGYQIKFRSLKEQINGMRSFVL